MSTTTDVACQSIICSSRRFCNNKPLDVQS